MSNHEPASDTWSRRVQALLAKAASTDFPAEAETLLAKAQELMARHAIDEAMLVTSGGSERHEITTDVVVVEPPYAGPRSALLSLVADANNCRMVVQGGDRGARTCVVVGNASDIEKVRTMFAALSLHATRTMLAARVPASDAPRRFRHAFLLAFALRIGERLKEAARSAAAEAEAESVEARGGSVEVVLRRRIEAVDDAVAEHFPRVRILRTQASSHAGIRSGRAAADAAGLDQHGAATIADGAEACERVRPGPTRHIR